MWLAAAIIVLVLVLIWFHTIISQSPESKSLTYQIVSDAIKSQLPWYLVSPHQMLLLGPERVLISNRWHTNTKSMLYKVYVRVEDGVAIVSNSCRHGLLEYKMSLAGHDSVNKLGMLIDDVITKHIEEGCSVYDPNYDF